jgi:S-adenosylmethionine:tRNA ribosyltransferase-isomerase
LKNNQEFRIAKLEIYEKDDLPSRHEAFQAILDWMDSERKQTIMGSTEIFIMEGYEFKVCDGLITNFHQPGSTLLMLINAFLKGNWKKVYDHALNHHYRFLSYGDSSLLMP